MIVRKKIKKVAKGYRLKPKTYQMIKEIQMLLNCDQDTVISKACRMLYKEIERKKQKKE